MKKVCIYLLMTALAVSLSACGGAAVENKPTNTANANTNVKTVAAAPTADILLGMEKQAQEAYGRGDAAYFEGMLSDKAMMSMGKQHMNKAGIVAMMKTAKCEMPDGAKLSDPQMSKIDNDTYAFSYKNETTGKCSEGGKMVNMKPMRAATIWVRNGETWQAAWHGETDIVMPKGEAKKDDAKKEDAKKVDSKKPEAATDAVRADVADVAAKKEEAKKDAAPKKAEAAKDVAKKEDSKKDEAKKDEKAAPVPAPQPDANTDALVKIHTSGWEAWKAKDAKKLEDMTTADMSVVGPTGLWFSGKSAVVKQWTDTMKCEGVTKVSVTDGFASALSPTVELLTLKGTSDGTCDGQKNSPLWQTAAYVKEGNDWKLAFMFETPAA